jgi:hypothetical protein
MSESGGVYAIVRVVEVEEAVTRPAAPPRRRYHLPVPPAVIALAAAALVVWLPAVVAVLAR